MAKPATIAAYISAAPKERQAHLRAMLDCLRKAAPGAEEGIKWRVPTLSYRRILFSFAAFKKHLGFYPTPGAIKAFETELSDYKTSKGAIQFPYDKSLPLPLIRKIAKYRVRELLENDARWM